MKSYPVAHIERKWLADTLVAEGCQLLTIDRTYKFACDERYQQAMKKIFGGKKNVQRENERLD